MAKWEDFTTCPHCGLDLGTGEGERGCAWGDCPYVPEELDVYCPQCRFNFVTQEGNPPCADPLIRSTPGSSPGAGSLPNGER